MPERPSIGELYHAHRLAMVRLAVLLVDDRATAEDVVQDAFTALQRRFDGLYDRHDLFPYLRTSVINGCRTALRRRHRPFRGVPEPPVWSAESAAMLGEDHREVFLAVGTLPRRQRAALILRYYLDLSEQEIAQLMGISRGTVKSTTSRALAALAKKLGDQE
jgi:RNA polymerase sigma-70 factor (sigma-E family)